jgi:hypothetical protein
MCNKNLNGKEPLPEKEFVKNFMVNHDLMFEKEVGQWTLISHAFNVLLTYAMPSMISDGAITLEDDMIAFQ